MKKELPKLYVILLSIILFIISYFGFSKISDLLLPKVENVDFYTTNLRDSFLQNLYYSLIIGITPIFIYGTWVISKIKNVTNRYLSIILVFMTMLTFILLRMEVLKLKFKNLPILESETGEIITHTFNIKNLNYEYFLLIGLISGCILCYLIFKSKVKKIINN